LWTHLLTVSPIVLGKTPEVHQEVRGATVITAIAIHNTGADIKTKTETRDTLAQLCNRAPICPMNLTRPGSGRHGDHESAITEMRICCHTTNGTRDHGGHALEASTLALRVIAGTLRGDALVLEVLHRTLRIGRC
jgi:hypothetical protein